ncbi:uncharacterized protein LOC141623436 [Silene latifolia]|uniref:uncharacterized protein LOC141623436 n=1 Tax=Silene latifolia TaxID=37657 RepID=UPI003D77CF54
MPAVVVEDVTEERPPEQTVGATGAVEEREVPVVGATVTGRAQTGSEGLRLVPPGGEFLRGSVVLGRPDGRYRTWPGSLSWALPTTLSPVAIRGGERRQPRTMLTSRVGEPCELRPRGGCFYGRRLTGPRVLTVASCCFDWTDTSLTVPTRAWRLAPLGLSRASLPAWVSTTFSEPGRGR